MAGLYVYRMDDITADMDWEQFWRYMGLFGRHGVRPLLGVVPDCRDPRLAMGPPNPQFWTILRGLKAERRATFAQHGFQHVYHASPYGLLARRYGFKPQSEFVGLEYAQQMARIRAGREILEREGLGTDVWMAPSNSFDRTTLRALGEAGFAAVTDGIALYPYESDGLTFVPQQIWRPHRFPFGVWTIALHINERDETVYREVEAHLRSGARVVDFDAARAIRAGRLARAGDIPFRGAYMLNVLRKRLTGRLEA